MRNEWEWALLPLRFARGTAQQQQQQQQLGTVEQKDKADVPCWPSTSECNPGNKTGAPLGIEAGLRGPGNHRGRGHSCGAGTKAREHSEALPDLGSEKKVHGALLKRRQIRLPRATGAVAHKPLWQGKKSSAKARGHMAQVGKIISMESSQGPPLFYWPPAVSSPPYMTVTLGQQLIVSPSVELHEAVASSNPISDLSPLPCSTMEHHPPEQQVPAEKLGFRKLGREKLSGCGPTTSDQPSVSAILECQETLEAAEALMTLKNSSWTWRQTHS
ncbi:doublesex- and mab-3-related transcription factor C1-like [Onychomys torridus]|uniref:doublesex- and mab-3-related transcription factor C1-like n=1 Tax=Onychomys torridus TaxID=38674 RepID=UPI00167F66D8|nr:doublesex- and mab-3-related transcription factor C1-like [Onychomys torridus]